MASFRVLDIFECAPPSYFQVVEQRRLEQLADLDAITKRQDALEEENRRLKSKRKAKNDRAQEPGEARPQVLQRKFLKIKDFQHVSTES